MPKFHLQDVLNFLSKLTWKRVWNLCQVLLSYYRFRLTGEPRVWGMPVTVAIEPTTACNLRCPECPSGLRQFSRPTGKLQTDFFRATIDDVADRLLYLIFYFQGEPYLHPEFLSMVRYATDRGIYTITSTNGHFLNDAAARATVESGLDRLIISVDGSTQETYQQYRIGGSLENVVQGAKNVVRWKRHLRSATPHVVFQTLVVRPNEHQLGEIQSLAREIGVDEVVYKTAQLYDYRNGHPLLPENPRYARYRRLSNGTYALKYRLLNRCWKSWHACVITWDGQVAPCCFDKDVRHPLGDLKQTSLHAVWHGARRHAFQRRIQEGRHTIDICTNCSEGCKVWVGAKI